MVTATFFRPISWLRRLALLVALAAFVVPSTIGPLGMVCACADGARHAATGCCCGHRDSCCDAERGPAARRACHCPEFKTTQLPAALDRVAEPLPEPALVATMEPASFARPSRMPSRTSSGNTRMRLR